jgi:rod shape-determining protein MreD
MVRAALQGRRIGQGPRPEARWVPAATVAAASLLSALPVVTVSGWYPDLAFLALLAWRLLRADPWPSWWAAPLGLFNDLATGAPIGFSVTLWTAASLLLDLVDRRTMWRDYWTEWALAAALVFLYELAEWRVASLMSAPLPFSSLLAPVVIATLSFPVIAWVAARLDRWRLGQ